MKVIETREEYDFVEDRGFHPLFSSAFEMSHGLRVEIQREMFGKNDAEGNRKFYAWNIDNRPMVCEECGCPIVHPSAMNVSHIITRGSRPDMAHDPRNVNILCPRHHAMWEDATTRESMRIFHRNCQTISMLREEYSSSPTK